MKRSSFGCCFDYVLEDTEKRAWLVSQNMYEKVTFMLPAAQEGCKVFWYSASWSHSLCPVKNCLRIVLVCIAYLWFPKNHAPGGDRWSTACLTIFPPYNQCASCVQDSRKGGTRAGLHQLHIAWRDVDGFHFLCAIWMQRKENKAN